MHDLARFQISRRLVFLSILFTLELVSITIWLDGATLLNHGGWIALLGSSGTWLLRGVVAFAALFATLAVLQMRGITRGAMRQASDQFATAKAINPK